MPIWNPETFDDAVVTPAMHFLAKLGGPVPSDAAGRMLIAIALQESNLAHRYQQGTGGRIGPARGWWQFEQGGGVAGVLRHPASKDLARAACEALYVEPEKRAVWRALEGHNLLAGVFARLLLWTHPHALPVTEATAWGQYKDIWRPGKPHPARWGACWEAACEVYPL